MKTKLLPVLLTFILLTGCGTSLNAKQPVLPTVVLEVGSANTPAAAIQTGSTVHASGIITPVQEVKLAARLAGDLLTVSVKLGDSVSAGQVLATFSGRENLALTAALEAANLEVLMAEDALRTLNSNADQARSDAFLRLANAQKALDEVQKKRAGQNYRNGSDSSVEAARADLILANDQLDKAQEAYNAVSNKADDDVIKAGALSALSAARKAHDRAVANLNYLLAMPNQIDVNQVDAELQAAQVEVDDAQRAYDKLKDGLDPDQVALAEARIKNSKAQLAVRQSALEDLQVKAPFAGIVSQVLVHSGEWVSPGQAILVLVDVQHLQVETTDLSERDVPSVTIGQSASVLIKALNKNLSGTVSAIAPMADLLGGDVVYRTIIELETVPPELRAGMSVDVQFENP